jgi:hypothetical protein
VTVGDSVRVSASYSVAAGTTVRLGDLDPSPDAVVLVPPAAAVSGTGVRVSFTVSLFSTGNVAVRTPTVELIGPDGSVQRIPPAEVGVLVASVLPPEEDNPALKPGFNPILRNTTRAEPLVFLQLLVVFAAFAWWKIRTREPPTSIGARPAAEAARAPLDQWAAAGEIGTVAEIARRRLQRFLAEREAAITESSTTGEMLQVLQSGEGDLPFREIDALLAGLDRVAFAPAHGSDVSQLASQVDDLIAELEDTPTEVKG